MSEKRLIDANKLYRDFEFWDNADPNPWGLIDIEITIDEQPTIDAVEVVRCEDCKYWDNWGFGGGGCEREYEEDGVSKRWLDSDFCSYGERREADA